MWVQTFVGRTDPVRRPHFLIYRPRGATTITSTLSNEKITLFAKFASRLLRSPQSRANLHFRALMTVQASWHDSALLSSYGATETICMSLISAQSGACAFLMVRCRLLQGQLLTQAHAR